MNTTENPKQDKAQVTRVPWWIGFAGGLVFWEGMPWVISLLAPRYGWAAGRPGFWNLPGLILVIAGTAGLIWTLYLHFAQSRAGIEWVLDKSYMLSSGPYAFSRHPMYLSELTLFLGWVIFYGSIAALIAFLAACAAFNFFAVPAEERVLEARFGEAFRQYRDRVPRWLGRPGS